MRFISALEGSSIGRDDQAAVIAAQLKETTKKMTSFEIAHRVELSPELEDFILERKLTDLLVCVPRILKTYAKPLLDSLYFLLTHCRFSQSLVSHLVRFGWDMLRISDLCDIQKKSLKLITQLYCQDDPGLGINDFIMKLSHWSSCGRRSSKLGVAILDSLTPLLRSHAHRSSSQTIQAMNSLIIGSVDRALYSDGSESLALSAIMSARSFLRAFPQFDERSLIFSKTMQLIERDGKADEGLRSLALEFHNEFTLWYPLRLHFYRKLTG